jgi:hypothetical protein
MDVILSSSDVREMPNRVGISLPSSEDGNDPFSETTCYIIL